VSERKVRPDLLLENGLRFHMQVKFLVENEQKGLGLGIRYSTCEKAKMSEEPRRG
jgi:hypothetical protein